jgi:hypothetical protein
MLGDNVSASGYHLIFNSTVTLSFTDWGCGQAEISYGTQGTSLGVGGYSDTLVGVSLELEIEAVSLSYAGLP